MRSDIQQCAGDLSEEMIRFTRKLVQTPSFTGREGDLARLVREKMVELAYDHVATDGLGNVIGVIGNGPVRILFDSHMDTVAVNHPEEWRHDPFGGEITAGRLYGRGAADMKGALSAAVFAGHMIRRLGLHAGKTVYITATVMEEDYDGEAVYAMCRQMAHPPDYAVICEPSDLELALGHKGRALIRVTAQGVSAHGSAPGKGENAVYRLIPVLERIVARSNALAAQPEPKGSIALTRIRSSSESLNAIPDRCELFLDRRLVTGEDQAAIAAEMQALTAGTGAGWEIYDKRGTSYTGTELVLHSYLPPWEIAPDSPLAAAGIAAFQDLFGRRPRLTKWDFSTNGVATAGRLGIPTMGFGPGDSKRAHTVDEYCEISQIPDAAMFYAALCQSL